MLDRYRNRSNSSSVSVHRRTTTTRGYCTARTRCTRRYIIKHDRFIGSESLDDLTLRAEDAVERLVWLHLDDEIATAHHHSGTGAGAGTDTNGVDGVEVGVDGRWSMVDHGKLERSTLKSEADSGTMSLSSAMGCASLRWSLPYSGGVRMPSSHRSPIQKACQYWLEVSDHWSFLMHCDEFI